MQLTAELSQIAEQGIKHEFGNADRLDREFFRKFENEDSVLRKASASQLLHEIKATYAEKPKLFISFCFSPTGRAFYARAKEIAEKTCEVDSGFHDSVAFGGDIERSVVDLIRDCDIFVGIWTIEFTTFDVTGVHKNGRRDVSQQGTGPGVWMPIELGMARAFGKTYRTFYDQETHEKIHTKPNGNQPSISFESLEDFSEKFAKALPRLIAEVKGRPQGRRQDTPS